MGIVRGVCVACRRMFTHLKKFNSKSNILPASSMHSYTRGMRVFGVLFPSIFPFSSDLLVFPLADPNQWGKDVSGATRLSQQLSVGTLKIITHLKAYFWLGENFFCLKPSKQQKNPTEDEGKTCEVAPLQTRHIPHQNQSPRQIWWHLQEMGRMLGYHHTHLQMFVISFPGL